MANENEEVTQFVEALEHPLKDAVVSVRAMILDSNEQITEQVKWNAPSFCFKGEDRVTFRLQPRNRVQLIFHRGAKVKDTEGFVFDDDTELLEWVAVDRAVFDIPDMNAVTTNETALVEIVNRWMKATT